MSVRTMGLIAGLTTGLGLAHRVASVAGRRGPTGSCADCARVLPVQYLEAVSWKAREAI